MRTIMMRIRWLLMLVLIIGASACGRSSDQRVSTPGPSSTTSVAPSSQTPESSQVTDLPDGYVPFDEAWRAKAEPVVAQLKEEYARRLGIIKSKPPAGFIIPIVGMTPHDEDEIEAQSPEGGSFEADRARVAEVDLNALLDKIQAAELDGVSTTGILGDEGKATVGVDTRHGGDVEAVRARVNSIVQNYIDQTALPAGSSTDVGDYVSVEAGWFSD